MGDPAGIGPEVVIRALADAPPRAAVTVFGDAAWLARIARRLRVSSTRFPGPRVRVAHCPDVSLTGIRRGRPSPRSGHAALMYVCCAVAAWERGELDALVTAPASKAAVQSAGHWFPGHTEWLARRLRARQVGMLFVGGGLRVMLVTRHERLRDVPALITRKRLTAAITLCARALQRDFGLRRPRIAVAGLNPHAGESGALGTEERRVIAPTLRALKLPGVTLLGPLSPDAVFFDAVHCQYDAVVVMYHDQGLIPFKMVARDEGVNVTLGLPCIRTAPDHGTAFDIAPRFRANPGAMLAAIDLAIRLCERRAR